MLFKKTTGKFGKTLYHYVGDSVATGDDLHSMRVWLCWKPNHVQTMLQDEVGNVIPYLGFFGNSNQVMQQIFESMPGVDASLMSHGAIPQDNKDAANGGQYGTLVVAGAICAKYGLCGSVLLAKRASENPNDTFVSFHRRWVDMFNPMPDGSPAIARPAQNKKPGGKKKKPAKAVDSQTAETTDAVIKKPKRPRVKVVETDNTVKDVPLTAEQLKEIFNVKPEKIYEVKQVYLGGKQEEAKEEKTDTLKHEVPEVNEEVAAAV